MQVSAILHPLSSTAREWRSRRVTRGIFMGVVFLRQGTDYVAADLDPDVAALFEAVQCVRLELLSAPAPAEGETFSDDELFAPLAKKSKK